MVQVVALFAAVGGFNAALSVLAPPREVEAQVFKGANAARFVQVHKFHIPKGRSTVRLSLAGIPISRDAVEVRVEGAKVVSRSHPPDMPDSIVLGLDAPRAGTCTATVTYYAPGLDWDVVYSLYADPKDGSAVLVGYARVLNRTGREIRRVKVRLATLTKEVLEEILRLLKPETLAEGERKAPPVPAKARGKAVALLAEAGMAPPAPVPSPPKVAPKVVAEYWEISLPERYDIPQRGETDALILSAPKVKGEVVCTFGTAAKRRGFKFLEVKNDEEHGLPGTALPPGTLWVFTKGPGGSLAFSLSEPLEYRPPGAKLRLPLGPARDVECKRKVVSYAVSNLRYVKGRGVIFDAEKAVKFELRNLSGANVKVEVKDRLHPEAEVIEASHKFERPSATEIKFALELKPGERGEVSYRVRYRAASPGHPIVREIQALEVSE